MSSIECVICLDPLGKQECHTLPCGHTFHKECHEMWVEHNPTCPLCRDGEGGRRTEREQPNTIEIVVEEEEEYENTDSTTADSSPDASTGRSRRGVERNSLSLLFLCLLSSFAQSNIGKDITSFVTQIVGVFTILHPRGCYPLLLLLWCGYIVEPEDHLLLERRHRRPSPVPASNHSSRLGGEEWGAEQLDTLDQLISFYLTGVLTLYVLYYPKMRHRMDSFPNRSLVDAQHQTPFSSSSTNRPHETEEGGSSHV